MSRAARWLTIDLGGAFACQWCKLMDECSSDARPRNKGGRVCGPPSTALAGDPRLSSRSGRHACSSAPSAASQVGDWLYNAALLGYVFSATHSAAWVGAATICRLLPYVLLGPLGGAIADRHPRRTVLVVGSLLRLVLMLVLAAVVAGHGPVALMIAVVAVASAAGSAERPAALSLLPRLVGEGRLGPANALLHTVQDLGRRHRSGDRRAPARRRRPAGGLPRQRWNVRRLGAAVLDARRQQWSPRPGAASTGRAVSDGVRTARVTRFVIPLIVIVAMVEFTYGAQTVQLVVYASRSLDWARWLRAPARCVRRRRARQRGLQRSTRDQPPSDAGRGERGGARVREPVRLREHRRLVLALVVTVAGGAGLVCSEVVAETVLARVTPRETLGRIAGLFDASSIAAMVGGAVLASILVKAISLQSSFWILGAATVLVASPAATACGGSTRRARSARRRSRAAGDHRAAADHAGDAAARSRTARLLFAVCPLPAGVDVVVQGAPAHAFYAVEEGRVVVHRDGDVGAHSGRATSFGERGLLDNAPRNATVTTETDTTVLRIDGGVLLEVLEQAPMLTTALDRSNGGRPLVDDARGERQPVDDPRWAPRDSRRGDGGRGRRRLPGQATHLRAHGGARRTRSHRGRGRSLVQQLVMTVWPRTGSPQITGDPDVDARPCSMRCPQRRFGRTAS